MFKLINFEEKTICTANCLIRLWLMPFKFQCRWRYSNKAQYTSYYFSAWSGHRYPQGWFYKIRQNLLLFSLRALSYRQFRHLILHRRVKSFIGLAWSCDSLQKIFYFFLNNKWQNYFNHLDLLHTLLFVHIF